MCIYICGMHAHLAKLISPSMVLCLPFQLLSLLPDGPGSQAAQAQPGPLPAPQPAEAVAEDRPAGGQPELPPHLLHLLLVVECLPGAGDAGRPPQTGPPAPPQAAACEARNGDGHRAKAAPGRHRRPVNAGQGRPGPGLAPPPVNEMQIKPRKSVFYRRRGRFPPNTGAAATAIPLR